MNIIQKLQDVTSLQGKESYISALFSIINCVLPVAYGKVQRTDKEVQRYIHVEAQLTCSAELILASME